MEDVMCVRIFLDNPRVQGLEPIFPTRVGSRFVQPEEAAQLRRDVSFRAMHVTNGSPYFSVTNRDRKASFTVAAGPTEYHKLAQGIAERNPDAIVILR